MALLSYWRGLLQLLVGVYVYVWEGYKWPHPSTSLFSRINNRAPVLCLQLSSTPCSFTFRGQAPGSTLSRVLSQMRLFSPAHYFRRTAALTCSTPLQEGLTEQWPNEQWPNVGCTQERLLDPAAAGAQRLRPGASPPQKKFAT